MYAKQRYIGTYIYVGEKKSVASRAYVDSFYYIHTYKVKAGSLFEIIGVFYRVRFAH